MKKINVIYFSNSGNTEAMANAVAKGAEGEDIAVKLITFGATASRLRYLARMAGAVVHGWKRGRRIWNRMASRLSASL